MSGRRRLHLGHGTYGVTGLRLDDALGLLADLGYDGAELTFDHMHLDPLAPALAARFRALGDVPLWRQRKDPVAGGKLPDATTRSNRSWTRSTPASRSSRSRRLPRRPATSTACLVAWRSYPPARHPFPAATAASPRATTTVRSSCSPPPAQYPAVERPQK
ncbi:hypothetical protein ASD08_46765 [Streptomyces sp. Root369]|nr:hypothetical protein ASD08_46765 [Streptomyces sp. Root369]